MRADMTGRGKPHGESAKGAGGTLLRNDDDLASARGPVRSAIDLREGLGSGSLRPERVRDRRGVKRMVVMRMADEDGVHLGDPRFAQLRPDDPGLRPDPAEQRIQKSGARQESVDQQGGLAIVDVQRGVPQECHLDSTRRRDADRLAQAGVVERMVRRATRQSDGAQRGKKWTLHGKSPFRDHTRARWESCNRGTLPTTKSRTGTVGYPQAAKLVLGPQLLSSQMPVPPLQAPR